MKSEMVKLEHNGIHFKVARPRLAEIAIATLLASSLPPAANVHQVEPTAIPALGEYWPGQGGINGGFVAERDGVPAHYLIFAASDVGEHAWGRYREESEATSKWDGKANTDALIAVGGHPAAEACRAYTADGHSDFDLPAAAQLYQAWVNDLITEGYYWSSSQRSAYYAFIMSFADGLQNLTGKYDELRVRPVRRFFI
ncbi:DUF1566 domain-containing protein [Pseudomonas sp. SMV71]|uniref:DUF1566 domain-containing protein n=1 Tax=Pseudomonas sp. SMV71 TaxID=3390195 RepID=UPI003F869305